MRNRIWHFLAEIKFKSIYTFDCHKNSDRIYRYTSLFIAFSSATSVATWAVWQKIPSAWACIVAISQLLIVAMPYLPFLKNDNSFREMSFDFDALYLAIERLWYAFENDSITESEAEAKLYELKEQALRIEKEHKNVSTPEFKRWLAIADQKTDQTLKNQFHLG